MISKWMTCRYIKIFNLCPSVDSSTSLLPFGLVGVNMFSMHLNMICVLHVKLAQLEAELTEMNSSDDKLYRAYNELMEYKIVLQKV